VKSNRVGVSPETYLNEQLDITKQKLIEEPGRIMSAKLQISGVVITDVSSE